MRALLACSSPAPRRPRLRLPGQSASEGPTPARQRLVLETSFTSLQSPLTDNYPQIGRELSVDSRGLPWEYVSIASEILASPSQPAAEILKASFRGPDWNSLNRLAPLATPETMSEASNSSPPSPQPLPSSSCSTGIGHRPMMMRRTPKISGNLSTAADDLKNNLHFAMLSAKNYYSRGERHVNSSVSSSNSSHNSNGNVNSEASFESAKSLGQTVAAAVVPPPVPRRRDSVLVSREHRVCTAACCRDDLSDNSSPHTSASHSSRISHRVQIDFAEEENDTNGSSLDFYEAKQTSTEGTKDSSNDVFLSVRSSPECKSLMAPATDLGAEWRRNKLGEPAAGCGDASLPLLRGLSPTPQTAGQHGNSPFFNAKRKKYVYPITLVGRGESSV